MRGPNQTNQIVKNTLEKCGRETDYYFALKSLVTGMVVHVLVSVQGDQYDYM